MKKDGMKVFMIKNSVRKKMTLSFSAIMVVALAFFMILSLTYTRSTVYRNSEDYILQIIHQVNYDIDSYISYMENISSVIAGGSDVPSFLFDQQLSPEEREERKKQVYAAFATIRESREDIYNIAALSNTGRGVVNDANTVFSDWISVEELDWYQAALHSPTGIAISSSHVQNAIPSSYQWVITLSRALVNNKTGEREGVFFVDLNYRAISNLCDNSQLGEKGYIFILDQEGKVIFHPRQDLIYGGLIREDIDKIMESSGNSITIDTLNDEKIYTIARSEKTGWITVGVAYTSDLLKNDKQTKMLYFGIATLILVMVVVVSNNISGSITRPLEKLKNSMVKVQEGDFDRAALVIEEDNEIGVLSSAFNVMTQQIHTLMEQNVYEQQQKRKSELKALQSQINPHFLYNTLDSIIWMSEAGRNEEVVEMTSALARLLRQTIGNDEEMVTLQEEIDYVRSYLTIQKMRYNDKLDYTIDVDSSILGMKIFKFALQPLVENAIYHGLKYRANKGILEIRGYRENGCICLEICDNGVGMDPETLRDVNSGERPGKNRNGVGVDNVQKRFRLYYGNDCDLIFESKKGEGTRVRILIPEERRSHHDEEEHL